MNREETKKAIEIMQAFVDGKTIEGRFKTGKGAENRPFIECPSPAWDFEKAEYRVKDSIPDYIDWSHVDEKFNFMARDKSGLTYLYERKPSVSVSGFWFMGGRKAVAKYFSSFKQGDTPWDESLVKRPAVNVYTGARDNFTFN